LKAGAEGLPFEHGSLGHDRDFRITFGAIIMTTVGLAALISRVAHWI
jgi:hypothetical protein